MKLSNLFSVYASSEATPTTTPVAIISALPDSGVLTPTIVVLVVSCFLLLYPFLKNWVLKEREV